MKVLVVGGGGREHALAWRLQSSSSVSEVFAAPGNPGCSSVAVCYLTPDYVQLAERLGIDLTVVGPEAPLVAGIVDAFRERGMPIVGPTAANAALEGSKIHSKILMQELGVPTSRFERLDSFEAGISALARFDYPLVLKTDGLAAGKGVVIARSREGAIDGFRQLAWPMIVEEFLEGEEVSFIALCDGNRALALEPSQDHKRAYDDDEGPNTGGMGAYSDSRLLTSEQCSHILDTIISPVVHARKFSGFLYAGLMMTANGPSVLEFNVRLGDPETQALMLRLESDWGEVLMAAARGSLPSTLKWSSEPATCVVLASGGYPGSYSTGHKITGLDKTPHAVVFHAGTRFQGEDIVTSGGRVLGVTARGHSLQESIRRAYAAAADIHFAGMQYRRDIGQQGVRRWEAASL